MKTKVMFIRRVRRKASKGMARVASIVLGMIVLAILLSILTGPQDVVTDYVPETPLSTLPPPTPAPFQTVPPQPLHTLQAVRLTATAQAIRSRPVPVPPTVPPPVAQTGQSVQPTRAAAAATQAVVAAPPVGDVNATAFALALERKREAAARPGSSETASESVQNMPAILGVVAVTALVTTGGTGAAYLIIRERIRCKALEAELEALRRSHLT
ncbi:MAG: hypothetical protein JXB47_03140 [Anaerolineae bacterium]|nr:hypothetical protein [Anaerolineae bacterium]